MHVKVIVHLVVLSIRMMSMRSDVVSIVFQTPMCPEIADIASYSSVSNCTHMSNKRHIGPPRIIIIDNT